MTELKWCVCRMEMKRAMRTFSTFNLISAKTQLNEVTNWLLASVKEFLSALQQRSHVVLFLKKVKNGTKSYYNFHNDWLNPLPPGPERKAVGAKGTDNELHQFRRRPFRPASFAGSMSSHQFELMHF